MIIRLRYPDFKDYTRYLSLSRGRIAKSGTLRESLYAPPDSSKVVEGTTEIRDRDSFGVALLNAVASSQHASTTFSWSCLSIALIVTSFDRNNSFPSWPYQIVPMSLPRKEISLGFFDCYITTNRFDWLPGTAGYRVALGWSRSSSVLSSTLAPDLLNATVEVQYEYFGCLLAKKSQSHREQLSCCRLLHASPCSPCTTTKSIAFCRLPK